MSCFLPYVMCIIYLPLERNTEVLTEIRLWTTQNSPWALEGDVKLFSLPYVKENQVPPHPRLSQQHPPEREAGCVQLFVHPLTFFSRALLPILSHLQQCLLGLWLALVGQVCSSSEQMIANFTCQLGWAMGCSNIWSDITLAVSMRACVWDWHLRQYTE